MAPLDPHSWPHLAVRWLQDKQVSSEGEEKAPQETAIHMGQPEHDSASPKPHPSQPPVQHATIENGSCAAIFGMLRCRSCTATFVFLQCRRHFDPKLRCSKRKTALQHCVSCIAGKWRFPAAFLRISSSHV